MVRPPHSPRHEMPLEVLHSMCRLHLQRPVCALNATRIYRTSHIPQVLSGQVILYYASLIRKLPKTTSGFENPETWKLVNEISIWVISEAAQTIVQASVQHKTLLKCLLCSVKCYS